MAKTKAELVSEIVERIKPLFAGHDPDVQGAILADLVAIHLAGYQGGDMMALREHLLALHVETVQRLVPLYAAAIARAAGGAARIARPTQFNLLELAAGPHLTPAQRRKLKPRVEPTPSGHVALPGTGPAGETCGSCQHLVRKKLARVYLKCGLNYGKWTGGGKSDVRARDAACSKWEPAS